jgi:hypothetical protein
MYRNCWQVRHIRTWFDPYRVDRSSEPRSAGFTHGCSRLSPFGDLLVRKRVGEEMTNNVNAGHMTVMWPEVGENRMEPN